MERREELRKLVPPSIAPTIYPMIDEMVFLEGELIKLRACPMIKIDPNDPTRQKATPAAKLYKEFLQQYTNCVKVVAHAVGDDGTEEESPLRAWIRAQNANKK